MDSDSAPGTRETEDRPQQKLGSSKLRRSKMISTEAREGRLLGGLALPCQRLGAGRPSFLSTRKMPSSPGSDVVCVCVCVVPATRERCEGWIWICRWADSTTREPEVDQMSSSLRTEMGAPQPRSTAFLFFFVSREAGGRGRLPIGRPAVG